MLRQAAKIMVYAIICAALWTSHTSSLWVQYAAALLISGIVGMRGYRKQSLDFSGEPDYSTAVTCILAT